MTARGVPALFAGALGGAVLGYDAGLLSSTLPGVQAGFSLTPAGTGQAVSMGLAAVFAGSAAAAQIIGKLGPVRTIQAAALTYLLGAVSASVAPATWQFINARVLIGLAVGVLSVVCPMFLAEMAAPHRRGRVTALFQLALSTGVLLAYLSHALWRNVSTWRQEYQVALGLPAALLLASAGVANRPIERQASEESGSGLLLTRQHRRALLTAVLLATFNQLSGVGVMLYYLAYSLRASQYSSTQLTQATVGIALFNLAITALALLIVDRIDRRLLLAAGSAGMALSLLLLAGSFANDSLRSAMVPGIIAFNFCFSLSEGAIFWTLLSELFTRTVRARGVSVAAAVHWFWVIAVSWSFPVVFAHNRAAPFLLFAFMMVLQCIFAAVLLPETRGKALDSVGNPSRVDPC